MLLTILILFAGAVLAPLLSRSLRGIWVLAGLPAALLVFLCTHLPLAPGEAVRVSHPWFPALGVEVSFALDGLSALFGTLILGIGALVILYSGSYLEDSRSRGRFLAYLLAFMGAMLGLVLSDNLITLFVFWELTSITSYFLIGFDHERGAARDAALKALLITGAGGLALLVGFVLMAIAGMDAGLSLTQALTLSELGRADLRGHALYVPMVILVFAGAFTKSAQVPFHFWLPGAMAAPTPASAYLHSATMVKAGVYLLARLQPELGGSLLWTTALTGIGAATLLTGAAVSLGQRDLKRILAYSTLAILGLLTMLIGLGHPAALKAAVVIIVAHALYKAALFLCAGNIDHAVGTRDIALLGGLRSRLPATAAAAIVAGLSAAGLPPLIGFVGKEMVFAAVLPAAGSGQLATLVALAFATITVAASIALVCMVLLVVAKPFFGPNGLPPEAERVSIHDAPVPMILGPIALASGGVLLGLVPALLERSVGAAAAAAIAGSDTGMHLALWHGAHAKTFLLLGLSVLVLAAGWLLYTRQRRLLKPGDAPPAEPALISPERIYERALAGLYPLAGAVTRMVQSGYLHRYIAVIAVVVLLSVSYPLARVLAGGLAIEPIPVTVHELLIVAMIIGGAIAAARLRSRLGPLVALGLAGLGLALLFALYSAPDVAITLIMVEALTVLVLVLVFYHLPAMRETRPARVRLRDGLLAVLFGAAMTGLTLAAAALHLPADASAYYAAASLPEAQGRNVVNVILVDFRALDTMGEIVVVAAAALGIYAMVCRGRKEGRL